ncbi:hypothetical protein AFLA_013599 [Aspergillus flavus NRRL3357]|nr:hypothetical protein AFLA_013599 [Aspergillus flavus NRRL3357]
MIRTPDNSDALTRYPLGSIAIIGCSPASHALPRLLLVQASWINRRFFFPKRQCAPEMCLIKRGQQPWAARGNQNFNFLLLSYSIYKDT